MEDDTKADWAIQQIQIKKSVPLDNAQAIYKKITHRKSRKIRDTKNFYHFRVLPPTKFVSKSFRTKVINDNVRIVFGIIKPEYKEKMTGKSVADCDLLRGGSIFDYFTKAYDYVSNKVSSAFDYIKKSVSITDYSTTTKALLDQYGHLPIVQIVIRREPVDIALELALQGVSSGKWLELKKKYGFDIFFHLSMVVTIGGAVQRVMKSGRVRTSPKKLAIEKLSVVSINENVDITPDMETLDVPITSSFTIKDMFDKAREKYGDTRFFSYSALGNNNCQNFIQMILEVERLYTEPVKNFVFQDITQLVKELPESTAFISQGFTNLKALANKYLGIGGRRQIGGKKPCWEGYEQFGMKEKDGRSVPNCVPKGGSKSLNDLYKQSQVSG